ncbi:ComEC/Rec2 family competence protein [Paenibacillus sp. FSL H8-0537]|uniref:ComEC/Rec2 family competence protein n=1 Tax=Paenibacillus sp. FSL H8-0537 TaxID=2921399 RepID=UPI00310187C7
MNRRPLLWFAVCFVAGCASGAKLSGAGAALAAGGVAVAALALVLSGRLTRKLAAVCAVGFVLAAGERMWADARNVTGLLDVLRAAEAQGSDAAIAVEASGTIVSVVEIDGDRAIFELAVDAASVAGFGSPRQLGGERMLVQLRLEEQPQQEVAAAWRRGDVVDVKGQLAQPAGPANRGGFDYRRYLSSQNIHWLLQATGTGAIDIAPGPPWTAAALLGRVDTVRAWLGARLTGMYPGVQAGYMQGLVLGITDNLDPSLMQQFARLGLTHILAISGLHVAVFLYALGLILRLCRMTRERLLLTLVFAVPFYVLLSGASPSVVRAGVMGMLGLLAARMHKLKDGLHILAAAAVIMLAINPFYLENVSFQLSFIVTLGLILGVPPVRRAMPDWKRGKALLDLTAVSVVAQAVSFPVSIYYFNQFHLLSLPANLLLVPFISFIIMPLGGAALFIHMAWPSGGKLLAWASVYANDWTFWLVDWLAKADLFRTIWATPPLWWIAAWYGALALLFRALPVRQPSVAPELGPESEHGDSAAGHENGELETQPLHELPSIHRTGGIIAAHKSSRGFKGLPSTTSAMALLYPSSLFSSFLLLLALLFFAYYPDLYDRDGRVHVLDIGQGDSIYIRTPEGKHLLIDGGGTVSFRKEGEEWRARKDPFEVGKKVIAPLLMKRGVHQLDLLIVSHLDSDHIKGLKAVMDSIPVKGLLWNGSMKHSPDAEELLAFAVQHEIPMYRAEAGQEWEMGKQTKLTVLWPSAVVHTEKSSIPSIQIKEVEEQNEASVVLYLTMKNYTFLMTGDIGFETEERLMADMDENPDFYAACCTKIDVLKVAHHGSRYSTAANWLERWQPLSAAISAGATNSYGHPHGDVLGRLKAAGAEVRRTDQDGEIEYRAASERLLVRTMDKGN